MNDNTDNKSEKGRLNELGNLVAKYAQSRSLPLKGRWLVAWGGDTREQNMHYDVPNQKFAFDFLGVDGQGNTRKGEALVNEDYYAFGREILAPA